MRKNITGLILASIFFLTSVQAQNKRNIKPEDVYRVKSISNTRLSPDGNWVLYSLSTVDSLKDRYNSKLFMVSIDGKETVQLTEQTRNPSSPAWSPDGKYISFMAASKNEDGGSQLYLMDTRGGEPIQLTDIKGDIGAYKWFRDGSKIVFQISESSTANSTKTNIRKPYEIDRYNFKNDGEGYLDNRKTHLYLFDLKSKKLDTLTRGNHNETDFNISNDGRLLAFVSNVSPIPDLNSNSDVFILNLQEKSLPEKITSYKGADRAPQFSPNNEHLAYLRSSSEDNFNMYDQSHMMIYHLASKTHQRLGSEIDLSMGSITWSKDSKFIYTPVENDRQQNLLQLDIKGKSYKWMTQTKGVFDGLNSNSSGEMIATFSDSNTPIEIYRWNGKQFNRLTRISDDFLAPLKTAFVTGFEAKADDGNLVSGILYLPDSTSKNLPLVVFLHGGPVSQDEFSFDLSRQVLAGAGFAVAAVNYRGSTGRGGNYTKTIYADWGNKEVKDVTAATNHLIEKGYADANKLGIGGWSYGGLLTNYTIATDQRFKAAVSGAGSSLQLSLYGSDQYVKQYENELGKPWKNLNKWLEVSYPFFKVEEIKTPTLFMASQLDFNVPVIGAEQMYQAFKSVGIPTGLIIYPNQHHGLRVPSYIVHRFQKHIDWYQQYLK